MSRFQFTNDERIENRSNLHRANLFSNKLEQHRSVFISSGPMAIVEKPCSLNFCSDERSRPISQRSIQPVSILLVEKETE